VLISNEIEVERGRRTAQAGALPHPNGPPPNPPKPPPCAETRLVPLARRNAG
jgi:hypothetical protein